MKPELLKPFVGKYVAFLREDSGKQFLNYGTLLEVTDDALLIDFKGIKQVYRLDTILFVREEKRRG